MSGPWHPDGRATVSQTNPRALGICDRCGLQYNLDMLKFQYQWNGLQLINLRILVCDLCYDIPSEQLRALILPPDPVPVMNPRPEAYASEVPSYISIETDGVVSPSDVLATEDDSALIGEIQDTPTPNPDDPVIYPPGGYEP